MNLQLDRLLIKKPKYEIKEQEEEEEDFVSKLPDDILVTRIMSLLPDVDAYRTSILSKRWNHLPPYLPNLHFVLPRCQSRKQIKRFYDTIDRGLALRAGVPIKRFFLKCSDQCSYTRFSRTIRTVVECQVKELDLTLPSDRYKVRWCWDLFKTNNTLVALTLKGKFVLDVPESELIFPCLKKLNLVSVVYYGGDKMFMNLISGCPVLEELFVERRVPNDKLNRIKLSAPSLKRLQLSFRPFNSAATYMATIDAPNLEYLDIWAVQSIFYLKKMLYIDEAHIGVNRSCGELLTCITSTKRLTLNNSTVEGLSRLDVLNMPMFPNLVKLVIALGSVRDWNLLLVLLNKMPNLEHITFLNGRRYGYHNYNVRWNAPVEEPPACMSFKLKEMIMLDQGIVRQDEFYFIRYLLEHSLNLETFTVQAREIDSERRQKLLNFHSGSSLCRIEFV